MLLTALPASRHCTRTFIYNEMMMVCHSDNSHSAWYLRPNKVLSPTLSVSQSGSTEAIVSDASHSPPKQVWALTFLL